MWQLFGQGSVKNARTRTDTHPNVHKNRVQLTFIHTLKRKDYVVAVVYCQRRTAGEGRAGACVRVSR